MSLLTRLAEWNARTETHLGALFARWPGIVAASANLAIGLCLLGREYVSRAKRKAPNGSPA